MIQATALVFKPTVHQFYTFFDWLSFIYHLWCALSEIVILDEFYFVIASQVYRLTLNTDILKTQALYGL